MSAPGHLQAVAVLSAALLGACGTPPGKPRGEVPPTPDRVLDFATLFAENCAACHGSQGRGGAAIALADPVYVAIVDEAAMRETIANGVRGTSMPPFARSAGGMLTDEQVGALVAGIRSSWGREGALEGAKPPSYAATAEGDAGRGEAAYRTYCAACHGPAGEGGAKGSAITNDSFLALVSDQGLRTIVIAGRPEHGAPDWRGNVPGRPMSDQEVTDVVSWLASHRVAAPGRPYSEAQNKKE